MEEAAENNKSESADHRSTIAAPDHATEVADGNPDCKNGNREGVWECGTSTDCLTNS